ncbi:MAG TPA: Ni/Fe hydrogenase subunit alpha [Polyangiaceae bacterium]|nr:Ni/Fe hydrogenase subunit alpha [Polyangiaceae bacterium]
MTTRIVIDPVTRIEGHAKISIMLDDSGKVSDARFHVAEFRGFEKLCEGRPLAEMPGITSRVCGICPVSHLLASAKATDAILAVNVPAAADKLRRLMNLAQIVQSHALSYFHLSSPDLLLGMESPPERRNLFGLAAQDPEYARGGIRLRKFGQRVIELLGGRKIHPSWAVPGGVRAPLSEAARDELRELLPEALQTTQGALERFKRLLDGFGDEIANFGRFPSLFMSLVAPDGSWEHYGGKLKFVDSSDRVVAEGLSAANYQEFIAEAVDFGSYMKPAFYRPLGYPHGAYRVGPLARLNVCERMGTTLADRELIEYRQRFAPPQTSSFLYHYARLIEMLCAVELIQRLVDDPELLSGRIRAHAEINCLEGVGVSEAPRGTLFHHYKVDENGVVQRVTLLIATGQNHTAMNRTVLQIAEHYIRGPEIPEGILNRLEAGIRSFDPCLSCSTHAIGQMPLEVTLLDPDGRVLAHRSRSGSDETIERSRSGSDQ